MNDLKNINGTVSLSLKEAFFWFDPKERCFYIGNSNYTDSKISIPLYNFIKLDISTKLPKLLEHQINENYFILKNIDHHCYVYSSLQKNNVDPLPLCVLPNTFDFLSALSQIELSLGKISTNVDFGKPTTRQHS